MKKEKVTVLLQTETYVCTSNILHKSTISVECVCDLWLAFHYMLHATISIVLRPFAPIKRR